VSIRGAVRAAWKRARSWVELTQRPVDYGAKLTRQRETERLTDVSFVISKISERGTNHPVVARLHLQTGDLLQASRYSPEVKDEAKRIYFEAGWRLLRCFDTWDELKRKQNELVAEAGPFDNPEITHIPHLVGLDRIAEMFLYEAKNFLRDISRVFEPLGAKKFTEAKALGEKAVGWAKRNFGDSDRLTNFLRESQSLVSRVIRMRNAVEHPGGTRAACLYIENFKLVGNAVQRPTWYLNGDAPLEVITDVGNLCEGMLIYAEELLALFIEKHLPDIIQIVEIPELEQIHQIPKRLKVDMAPAFYEKFLESTSPK
jgi:hypothetical protein